MTASSQSHSAASAKLGTILLTLPQPVLAIIPRRRRSHRIQDTHGSAADGPTAALLGRWAQMEQPIEQRPQRWAAGDDNGEPDFDQTINVGHDDGVRHVAPVSVGDGDGAQDAC
jgi:hypothetical protein